jgi:phytanoyl-CoA hydroxylase
MQNTENSTHILKNYHRDGYVQMSRFLGSNALNDMVHRVDRFIAEAIPSMPSEHVFYEDKDDPPTLKQLQRMCDYDPWFHELFTTGPFRELAEVFLTGPVVPKNLQYFNKPAGVGKATSPHQDGYYSCSTLARN